MGCELTRYSVAFNCGEFTRPIKWESGRKGKRYCGVIMGEMR